jgi:hypothetical protein
MEPRWDLSDAVEDQLGSVLRDEGFALYSAGRTSVIFVRGLEALSLEYLPEDVPSPWILVLVGRRDGPSDARWFVALWRAHPEVKELQNSRETGFDSSESLYSALGLIRDTWLPTYILPVLADEVRLRSVRADQEREIATEHTELIEAQDLRRARACFEAGDFEGAILQYRLYGLERLSAADRRRLAIARRSAESPGP